MSHDQQAARRRQTPFQPEADEVEQEVELAPPPQEAGSAKRDTEEEEEEEDFQQNLNNPSLHRSRSQAALLSDISGANQVQVKIVNVGAWVPIMVQASVPTPAQPTSSWPAKLKAKILCSSSSSGAAQAEKQVLFNITACVEPGEVLALMGPSGSGKSTLLSILGGRSMARTEGEMLFGGRKLDKPLKRKMGFVTQVGEGSPAVNACV